MSLPLPNRAAERRSQDRDLCTVDDVMAKVKEAMKIIDDANTAMFDGRFEGDLSEVWNKLDDAGGLLRKLRGDIETR